MSGYILTGGSRREVEFMRIIAVGAARITDKAYTLIGGNARLWYQRGTPLGSLAVGSTVKIAVGGKDYDWLVVHQGLPGSMYDVSCNGAWLLMKDVYNGTRMFGNGNIFPNSGIYKYLNEDIYNSIDPDVRTIIKLVKIPYTYKSGSPNYVYNGADGLSCKIFLLSCAETGATYSAYFNCWNIEGSLLSYFISGESADAHHKRIAYYNGKAIGWWLRSTYNNENNSIYYINSSGARWDDVYSYPKAAGTRPCMILPSDALVDDTGHIIGAGDQRTPLGWLGVGSTVKMDINGNKRVWRIAYKGNPNPDLYDESCNGVWLVLNTIYSTRANGSDCQYADGTIDTYLNSTFLGRIDKGGNAAKYIKDVKIPYAKKQEDGSWKVQTKENGLPCKVFLPSIFEIGGAENASVYKDGSALGYYDGSPSTLTLKQSGTPAAWRTRTVTSNAQFEFSVDASGAITTCAPTDVIGVVPCVIMKPDALVENGIIVGE